MSCFHQRHCWCVAAQWVTQVQSHYQAHILMHTFPGTHFQAHISRQHAPPHFDRACGLRWLNPIKAMPSQKASMKYTKKYSGKSATAWSSSQMQAWPLSAPILVAPVTFCALCCWWWSDYVCTCFIELSCYPQKWPFCFSDYVSSRNTWRCKSSPLLSHLRCVCV